MYVWQLEHAHYHKGQDFCLTRGYLLSSHKGPDKLEDIIYRLKCSPEKILFHVSFIMSAEFVLYLI